MAIRNIAIIAHVDHGKTTLVDALLTQSGTMKYVEGQDLIMDNNDQERERWITIYSKNTSVNYEWNIINIIDTPGHADFWSEVERVLKMVDSVLLVVDAYEWPMPQTKFVLKKSLERGLKPIVVINKIDKPTARPEWVINELFDAFISLWADNDQADFPIIYASAKNGYAFDKLEDLERAKVDWDIKPIFNLILNKVPEAPNNPEKPFRMQIANLWYDDFVWRLWIWRVYDGVVKVWQQVVIYDHKWNQRKWKISKLYTTLGLSRIESQQAQCGDIVTIAGIPDIFVWETVWAEGVEPFEAIKVDEPTLTMDFLVNDSPFAGRDGKQVTSRNLIERLEKELETNVWLEIDFEVWENRFAVSWRWELHLSVLIETMRREWFELQVSAPQVILRKDENWKKKEPIEQVVVTVDESVSGSIIEALAKRKWQMTEMNTHFGTTTLQFEVPTRWLLWFRSAFILMTKWEWIMYSSFLRYDDHKWDIPKRNVWSMISMESWKAMRYSIWKLQERWTIFVEPATDLYEGMIVWESSKPGDMTINLTKNKQQSNMRTSGNDENMLLTPIKTLTLEDALSYIWPDEYAEITPNNIRLRKIFLKEWDRKRANNKGLD